MLTIPKKNGYLLVKAIFRNYDDFQRYCMKEGLSIIEIENLNESHLIEKITMRQPVFVWKKRDFRSIVTKKYDYHDLEMDIVNLKNQFDCLLVREIGNSVRKKSLYELSFGKGPIKVHMNGSFHANEWITSLFLMNFIEHVLQNYQNPEFILYKIEEYFTLSIVPMVNPDGVSLVHESIVLTDAERKKVNIINNNRRDYLSWKANIKGVDLNKQYPAKWEEEKRRKNLSTYYYRDFGGYYPLSEPESIAMAKLALKSNFDYVFCFHTQGEEVYWGFEGYEPLVSKNIAELITEKTVFKSVKSINNYAGYRDWFIQEFMKPGFTIELGKGVNPLLLRQYNKIFQETIHMLEEVLHYIYQIAKNKKTR